jgi:hypothetical protein
MPMSDLICNLFMKKSFYWTYFDMLQSLIMIWGNLLNLTCYFGYFNFLRIVEIKCINKFSNFFAENFFSYFVL